MTDAVDAAVTAAVSVSMAGIRSVASDEDSGDAGDDDELWWWCVVELMDVADDEDVAADSRPCC